MKNSAKLNELQNSFAIILATLIKTDGKISEQERKKFNDFFKKEFELDNNSIDKLFKEAIESQENIEQHIELLKDGFKDDIMAKARFMQYLNETIISDGIEDKEYAVFEMIREKLF